MYISPYFCSCNESFPLSSSTHSLEDVVSNYKFKSESSYTQGSPTNFFRDLTLSTFIAAREDVIRMLKMKEKSIILSGQVLYTPRGKIQAIKNRNTHIPAMAYDFCARESIFQKTRYSSILINKEKQSGPESVMIMTWTRVSIKERS